MREENCLPCLSEKKREQSEGVLKRTTTAAYLAVATQFQKGKRALARTHNQLRIEQVHLSVGPPSIEARHDSDKRLAAAARATAAPPAIADPSPRQDRTDAWVSQQRVESPIAIARASRVIERASRQWNVVRESASEKTSAIESAAAIRSSSSAQQQMASGGWRKKKWSVAFSNIRLLEAPK